MDVPLHSIEQITVLTAPRPTFKERLAATELRRGLLRLGYSGRTLVGELPRPAAAPGELCFALTAGRGAEERYEIAAPDSAVVTIAGVGEQALLYGVFDFLERQGAYFGIDGDNYPLDSPANLRLPDRGQPWRASPRFATRGLLPWPDFLNCITVYNREDLRAYLDSMLRMRFNTLGIHVYGQRDKWVEPFLSFEYGGVGHAAFADTSATDRWGYLPQRTSRYSMGAAQYFDAEVFGANATRLAHGPWETAELTQALWREAFAYAEQLGIRTGVGFEPYQLPDEILRACPPEARIDRTHKMHYGEIHFRGLDPESRTARKILETRLNQLLEAYPSISHVYLWEDETVNWASQQGEIELSATAFKQAYDFLRRHAPDKRLVLAGWGGVVRNFETFHRTLPEDVIFTCLNDQVGWDPVHEVFGKLEGRERWPIPWIEDDPAMWFPQLHVHRFAKDLALAEQYGCQGVLGIHWRHRIVDPVANYQARRSWEADRPPAAHYRAYARTQASGERATALAELLERADSHRSLLATWNGEIQPDGHHRNQGFSGDYSEAFTVESAFEISDQIIESQSQVIAQLDQLVQQATTPIERERLGYLHGQVGFLDPYARAWRIGVTLHKLLTEQHMRKQHGESSQVSALVREQGLQLWVALLGFVRAAVLSFQRTVATRNDLGMLASIHNKFVRIATIRMRESLLEFLDELPPEAEAALASTLAPDAEFAGAVFVPTRPTRLAPGEQALITAVAPGIRELTDITLNWRYIGATAWLRQPMRHAGRRTYTFDLRMPLDAQLGLEYYVAATFAGAPEPLIAIAPPPGRDRGYIVTI
jgi:hypothetical protein